MSEKTHTQPRLTLLFFIASLVCLTHSTLQAQNANFVANVTSGCSPLSVQFTDLSSGSVDTWFWDFGNGNTSQFDDVIATYTSPGTYTVTLTVTDTVNGISSTRTEPAYITVFADPTADFSVDAISGCAPLLINFQDQSSAGTGALVDWLWDFGDGNLGTGEPTSHTYNSAGDYTLTLVVTDDNGCSDTRIYNDLINVTAVATVDFTASPQTGCSAPLTVNFNSSVSPSGNYSYLWDFGDGNTSTASNPAYTYTSNGDYNVSLTISDVNGCQELVEKENFVIINQPVADFQALNLTPCTNQTVQFENLSSGADSYFWNFGDGNTSTTRDPIHTYTTPGTYTVALTASNSAGCSDFEGKSSYITVNIAPAPAFSVSNNVGCNIPLFVSFQDSSIGNIVAWEWDFGNGNFSFSPNPTTTYTVPGSYAVSLSVTTDQGCQATETVPNYVLLTRPDAEFIPGNVSGCIPLTSNFVDVSTSAADPIVDWAWNFGDGNVSNLQSPSHTYTTAGQYTVTLTITTQSGCQNTEIYQFIEAGSQPTANFVANPVEVCIGEGVEFVDLTAGGVTEWDWSFGDNTSSNLEGPIHFYGDTGVYSVELIVEYLGCRDTLLRPDYIRIIGPLGEFTASPTFGCDPPIDIAFFEDTHTGTSWHWSFGDGDTSTLPNPVHTFSTVGSYLVEMTVTDSITGCVNQGNQTINITNPRAAFGSDTQFGCAPLEVNFTNSSLNSTIFFWDFGDGNTSTLPNPTHTYQSAGEFDVLFIASDGVCTDTIFRTAYIETLGPLANFGADVLTGCTPFNVQFSDSSQSHVGTTISNWIWDFGDGGTGSGPNPVHTYTVAGTYDVSLTVLDSEGCIDTLTKFSYITPTYPEAAFTTADTLACPGSLIQFVNQSSGIGMSYVWDFGDGTSSTSVDPIHLYSNNGDYIISLTVTDVNGCVDTEVKLDFVSVGQPTSSFVADTTQATCPPLTVNFTDQSSPDVVSWLWDFGDGSSSTLANPSKIYAVAGLYDVQLVVTNYVGCRDTLRMDDLIDISGPTGSFGFSPTVGCRPLTVFFEVDSPNPLWTYEWDFGDGVGGLGATTSHQYSVDTIANPVMIVTDEFGCKVPINSPNNITIQPLPLVSFQVNQTSVCLGQTATFTNTTTAERPIISYTWDFGDGASSTSTNPTHIYADTGTYVVNLLAETLDGCVDTASVPVIITVTAPPSAAFTINPTEECMPAPIAFTDGSSGDFPITDWAWDFGDGDTDNGQIISPHIYATDGIYTANLTITDSRGCVGNSSRSVRVHPLPPVDFDAFRYGCAPITVNFSDETIGISPNVAWLWDFGDGTTSSLENPSHLYTTNTNYTVTLTVTDANGCVNSITKTDFVQLSLPIANFTSNAGISCPPQTVQFTDTSIPDTTISWLWDFGDGSPASTFQNPVHTYYTSDTFDVSLIVTNLFGCSDTIFRPQHVITQEPPTAQFSVSDSFICAPANVLFDGSSSRDAAGNSVVSYLWDFGLGSGNSNPTSSFLYTTAGTYVASLVVTDANGCQDTAYKTITIHPVPESDFFAEDTIGCATATIQFRDISTGVNAPVAWLWSFGDGNSSTAKDPVNVYVADGTYDVSLVVTDINGCVDSSSRTNYIVLDHPTADFATSSTQSCVGATLNFTDQSFGHLQIVAWLWDFGDGSATSSQQNPSHAYVSAGSYDVTLTVTDLVGCQHTVVKSSSVQVYTDPIADFTYSPPQGCSPLTVSFTETSSDGSSPVVAYSWDFGDGGTAVIANPNYIFNAPGIHTITLEAIDQNGCRDSIQKQVQVLDVPEIDFLAEQRRGCATLAVQFRDLSTSINTKVAWLWDFGDGTFSTLPDPLHTYTSDGTYTVSLRVTDVNGCVDSLTKTDYIFLSHPVAAFTFNQSVVCPNEPIGVSFTDASTGDTTMSTWLWDFGDGTTSTQTNPSHSYPTSGTYSISLEITDVLGCKDTVVQPAAIQVLNGPNPAFTQSDNSNCTPLTINFVDQSTDGDVAINSWHWDFGNGDSSLQQDPTYTWNTAGTYTVTLTTTDINGCQASTTSTVQAYELPIVDFLSPDTLGCAPTTAGFIDQSTSPYNLVSWSWDFGDGNTSTLTNPANNYAADGFYTVSLTVTDQFGCSSTETKNQYVKLSHPVADFTFSNAQACENTTLQFTDTSVPDHPLTDWLWDFGDGTNSTLQNPTHVFTAQGTYTVSLTVTNVFGCSDTYVLPTGISILDAPTAQMVPGDTANCMPFVIDVSSTSIPGDAGIISWDWSYGDGSTAIGADPTAHTYLDSGTYTLSLIVVDANSCRDTVNHTIRAHPLPTSDFFTVRNQYCPSEQIQFVEQSTGLSPIVSWTWDFGDGNNSSLQAPAHGYVSNGLYDIELIIEDLNGCRDTLLRQEYIEISTPQAAFTSDLVDLCPGDMAQFTDTSVPDTTITAWQWSFGDGTNSTLQNPSHLYSVSGQYTVQLIITNVLGCIDTIIQTNYIEVATKPTAQFTSSLPSGCRPLSVDFTNTSIASTWPIASYAWDFGDGQTSTLVNPSISYSQAGTFDVELIVTDQNGCTDTAISSITVHPLPIADFTALDSVGCAPQVVNFIPQSSGTSAAIVSYQWYFGDGDSSTSQFANHLYQADGVYDVLLMIEDANGCRDTVSKPQYIQLSHPTAAFTVDQSQDCPGTAFNFSDASIPDTTLISWEWNFGDGTTGSGQNVSHVYTTPGFYDVQLVITNVFGCTDTILQPNMVEVATRPQAQFISSPSSGCRSLTVDFTNTSVPNTWPIVSYSWNFGNGQTSTLVNPSTTFSQAGTYDVELIATDQNGCTDTSISSITVHPLPVADFTAIDSVGCAPQTVNFIPQSSGTSAAIVSYQWYFGDGDSSNIQFANHLYQADGVYDVRLMIEDINGCRDTLNKPQYIQLSHPIAAFSVDQSQDCPGTAFNFSDTSTPDTTLISWNWNFGDGTSGTGQNVSHVYTTPGFYDVQLVITNVFGCTDTILQSSMVEVATRPQAQFTSSPSSGCRSLTVDFTNTSVPFTWPIVSYSWNFGNGQTSTLVNPSITFGQAGTYDVELIATDQNGCTDTSISSITVHPLPVADFTAIDSVGCAPQTVNFIPQSSGTSATIVSYQWYFGDGDSSNIQFTNHLYQADGVYDVLLMIEDANGCRDTLSKPQYIQLTHPTAAFSVDQNQACPGSTFNFSDTSIPDTTLISWNWDFGDGTTGSGQNVSHVYSTLGTYDVQLVITNVFGCTDTILQPNMIDVLSPPTAAFATTDTLGCAPFSVGTIDLSTGNSSPIVSWLWDLGNGDSATTQEPTTFYSNVGSYTISLTVTDLNGCSSSTSLDVEAFEHPIANFFTPDSLGCSEFIQFSDLSTSPHVITSWLWDFGDGNTSTQQHPVHTYSGDGTFTVSLIVFDQLGCSDTLEKVNYINLTRPVATFGQDLDVVCPGMPVQFLDFSIPDFPITAWFWDFGDGTSSTLQNPIHTYLQSGIYTVSLVITNSQGCQDTEVGLVEVIAPPTAIFDAIPSEGCVPVSIQFDDMSIPSTSPIVSWQWNFGTGSGSTLPEPTHVFNNAGNYITTLRISDANGCFADTTMNITIHPTPISAFTASPRIGCAPQLVNFVSQSDSLSDNSITSYLWNFGDGHVDTGRVVSHTYSTNGIYDVSLIVVDANGCTDTLIRSDYIKLRMPDVDFTWAPTASCPGMELSFTDQTVPDTTILSWLWDFGDGNTSTQQNPTHIYTNSGSYTISLTVSNILGCVATETKVSGITIGLPPVAEFSPGDTAFCVPAAIQFLENSTIGSNNIASYLWDFGDGTSSNQPNPAHLYGQAGSYTVSLTVFDQLGCSDTVSHGFTVRALPQPLFTATDSLGCSPKSITFLDQTSGGSPIAGFLWDFGDGSTSTSPLPAHTYVADGVYDVSLTLTDIYGCSNTLNKPQYIRLSHPQADFSTTQTQVCLGIPVDFRDTSIPDTSITDWLWDFGDGNTSTSPNPSHIYASTGTYTVSLTITNLFGCQDIRTQNSLIEVLTAPTAQFSSSDINGCSPLTVNFNNTSSPGSYPLSSWAWDFDNGTTSVFTNAVQTFNSPGDYDVQLIATDGFGCKDTTSQTITVFRSPSANFQVSDSLGCAPKTLQFLDQSAQGDAPISAWLWDFGDGNSSSSQFTNHTYATDGNYTVSILITDANGCQDSIEKVNHIQLSHPRADFSIINNQVCPGNFISFLDNSSPDHPLTSWLWDFGDGTTSTVQNPTHAYTTGGNYTVTLTVTNNLGCSDSRTKTNFVEVRQAPIAAFSPSILQNCTPFEVRFNDNSIGTSSPIVAWQWDYGDGGSASSQNGSHTYTTPDIYTVTLTVTDNNGCQGSMSLDVESLPLPTAAFMSVDSVGCSPHTAQMTDLSTGDYSIIAWEWDFGNGSGSTQQFPVASYATDGNYDVELLITDSNGCRDTLIREEYIRLTNPIADFTFDTPLGCPGMEVQFTDTSIPDTTLISWFWDFGDGTSSNVQNPLHVYQNPGQYTVSLTITNAIGCSKTQTQTNSISVSTPPVAGIGIDANIGCAPVTAIFSDQTTVVSSPIVSWHWTFGTGDSSSMQEPSYSYDIAGTYQVSLTVVDGLGCVSSIDQQIDINQSPIADFKANDSLGCGPKLVQFTDFSSSSAPLTEWIWDFGDGASSTSQHPAHLYQQDGVYTVQLITRDANGCTDTLVRPQYIRLSHPEADFDVDQNTACPGTPLQFTDESIADTTLIGWFWDFGDGNVSTIQHPSHVYTQDGYYDVELIVTNIHACRDTISFPNFIQIFEGPQSLISASDTSGCEPLTVTLTNVATSPYGFLNWEWTLDGIPVGQSLTVSQYFETAGDYEFGLSVLDVNGCVDTGYQTIIVHPTPEAAFTVSDTLGCGPILVNFTDLSSPVPREWAWDFGDGSSSTEQNPLHTYTDDGIYTISLEVTDEFGCTNEIQKINHIELAHPEIDFSIDYELSCPPISATFVSSGSGLMGIAKWEWNFGDGTTIITTSDTVQHDFEIDGIYDVFLIGTDSLGCSDTLQKEQVLEVLKDEIPDPITIHAVSVLSDNQVELRFAPFEGEYFKEYTIYREEDGNGFIPIHTSSYTSDTVFIDQTVNALTTSYCYKVSATNFCGTESDLNKTNQHCTIEAQATLLPDQVVVDWTPYIGWNRVDQYEIYKVDNYGTVNVSFIGIVPGNTTRFVEPLADCFTDVSYRIKAIGEQDLEISWSDTTMILSETGIIGRANQLVRATVENNEHVLVEWKEFDLKGESIIRLEKATGIGGFQTIATLPPGETFFRDEDVDVDLFSYTYQVSAQDSCGNTTPISNVGTSILLEAEKNLGTNTLTWTPYEEWRFGVQGYQIEVLNDTTGRWDVVDVVQGNITTYRDEITDYNQPYYCYRIRAIELGGNNTQSLSNEGCIRVETTIQGPNAFTPNGDDKNDFFYLSGFHVQTYNLKIYSRWGMLLFESNNMEDGWDGNFQGQPVREGVYVYVARGIGFNGQAFVLRGTVTLMR